MRSLPAPPVTRSRPPPSSSLSLPAPPASSSSPSEPFELVTSRAAVGPVSLVGRAHVVVAVAGLHRARLGALDPVVARARVCAPAEHGDGVVPAGADDHVRPAWPARQAAAGVRAGEGVRPSAADAAADRDQLVVLARLAAPPCREVDDDRRGAMLVGDVAAAGSAVDDVGVQRAGAIAVVEAVRAAPPRSTSRPPPPSIMSLPSPPLTSSSPGPALTLAPHAAPTAVALVVRRKRSLPSPRSAVKLPRASGPSQTTAVGLAAVQIPAAVTGAAASDTSTCSLLPLRNGRHRQIARFAGLAGDGEIEDGVLRGL